MLDSLIEIVVNSRSKIVTGIIISLSIAAFVGFFKLLVNLFKPESFDEKGKFDEFKKEHISRELIHNLKYHNFKTPWYIGYVELLCRTKIALENRDYKFHTKRVEQKVNTFQKNISSLYNTFDKYCSKDEGNNIEIKNAYIVDINKLGKKEDIITIQNKLQRLADKTLLSYRELLDTAEKSFTKKM